MAEPGPGEFEQKWEPKELKTGLRIRAPKSSATLNREKTELLGQNAQLKEKLGTDALTGLEGEYAFQDMLKGLEDRFNTDYPKGRYLQGSFLVIDADHLHDINRQFGELAGGDDFLKAIGEMLKDAARGNGRCFRKEGADNFVLYLPGFKVRKELEAKIDEMNQKLSELQNRDQEKYPGIKYGISVAVATFHRAYDPRTAYNDAFNAMKHAKEQNPEERGSNIGRIFVNELVPEDQRYE